MKDYVVLDIENPNSRNNSICAISILVVKNNEIVDTIYSLINPEDRFDTRNISINKINQQMVSDKPTFKDFWKKIDVLLKNNIIVGHNINYDLSIISRALDRYGINMPEFMCVDTLKLSCKYLNLNAYKLSEILSHIGYTYNKHNAYEDTLATFKLFKYLKEHFNINDYNIVQKYHYNFKLNNNIEETLSSNINDIYGIIKGINFDNIINEMEIKRLKSWINDNMKYKQYTVFDKIVTCLQKILEDNEVNEYERFELISLVNNIKESKKYNETTLSLQVLQGIIEGITCDKVLNENEIYALKRWLDINNYLAGIYPYDKITSAISKALEDGILTNLEKEELLYTFCETLNPIKTSNVNIDLNNKTFCLTGEFKTDSKEKIKEKLKMLGGVEKSSVTSKVNYLFVGSLGSEAWKFGKIGGKIARAQELQEKGCDIKIISEEDITNLLKEKELVG